MTTNQQQILGFCLIRPEMSVHVEVDVFDNDDERTLFQIVKNRYIEKKATDLGVLSAESGQPMSKILHFENECRIISLKALKELVEFENVKRQNLNFLGIISKEWHKLLNLPPIEQRQAIVALKEAIAAFDLSTNRYQVEQNPDLIDRFIDEYDQPIHSAPTGISVIDKVTGGIRPGHFITVLANSGVGKTNLLLNMASNLLDSGKKVLFFSLEMSVIEVVSRLFAISGNHSAFEIHDRSVRKEMLFETADKLKAKGLYLCEASGVTSNDVVEIIMEQQQRHDVDVVMVDYIQLLNDEKGKDTGAERIERICQRLKRAARNLGVPIIAPSQVDKESSKGSYIGIENAAGSKSIGDTSDLSLYLYTKESRSNSGLGEDNSELFLKVAKNRHGITGKRTKIHFDKRTLKLHVDEDDSKANAMSEAFNVTTNYNKQYKNNY